VDENDEEVVEILELWKRDPVEVIRELIGNVAFADNMVFAPERVFSDQEGRNRQYDEMSTADWWWDMQVRYLT
jgi:hypothetical protein